MSFQPSSPGEHTPRRGSTSIIVVGLGNPIMGDDGIGWRVAERLQARLYSTPPDNQTSFQNLHIEVDFLSVGGLNLMEHLVGYQRALIIDAITSGTNPPGTVTCFPLENLPAQVACHLGSAHDTSLQTAIQVGRTMGASLPDQIQIVAIEAQIVYEFSDQLTSPVAAAASTAEQVALEVLAHWTETEATNQG